MRQEQGGRKKEGKERELEREDRGRGDRREKS